MPVYRGTYYARTFVFTDENAAPLDITGWEFRAMFRAGKEDVNPPILELTTLNAGFVVSNGPAGLLLMQMLALETAGISAEVGKLVFDVLRTDAVPGPIWLFEGSVPVKGPITHD